MKDRRGGGGGGGEDRERGRGGEGEDSPRKNINSRDKNILKREKFINYYFKKGGTRKILFRFFFQKQNKILKCSTLVLYI